VRVGLFGGTFNPVHWGHLRAAEEIRERYNLTQVIFIPTNISPHKEYQEIIPAHHRLKMLDLAVNGNPCFFTSDLLMIPASVGLSPCSCSARCSPSTDVSPCAVCSAEVV